MSGYWLRRIEQLDPVADHHEIYRISIGFEFPWDYNRALEFALFRTYCVPSISRLLDATGEFGKRPQKRYDDTSLLMAELAEHGYDSPRGRAALSAVNRQHGHYAISNDDMLYVLSTFVYDPIDWIDEFGWRPLHDHERQAAFRYFREVGKRMAIRGIPEDFEEFRAFKTKYERENFRFSPTNQRVGTYTLDLFCSWYPKPLRRAAGVAVRGLLDQPMLTAFGFEPAPAWVVRLVRMGLRARSAVVRLLPRRRHSKLLNPATRSYPGYPEGYEPGQLGASGPPAEIDRELLRRPRA
jgi:hypothetical protein